jgi:hypothetical protein
MNEYTLELSFSGLCLFTFHGDRKKPDEVNVLFLASEGCHEGHQNQSASDLHTPRLTFSPQDLEEASVPYDLFPDLDGRQLAILRLPDLPMEIVAPSRSELLACWRDEDRYNDLPKSPPTDSDETWLDWIPSLRLVNPETPIPTEEVPWLGLRPVVIPRLRLTKGDLSAAFFLRDRNNDYVFWEFKASESDEAIDYQAMAGIIRLEIHGIPVEESVEIVADDGKFEVSLRPRRYPDGTVADRVRASFTNLVSVDPRFPPNVLEHFIHFYDLVEFGGRRPKLRVPYARSAPITSGTTYCPVSTHGGTSTGRCKE